jgi:hypothetical protein
VFINRPFVDQHNFLNTQYTVDVDYFAVSGNITVYDFQNSLAFPSITNSLGTQPNNENDYFVIDTDNGWDSASVDGESGSFDVEDTVLQERVVASIPYGKEVVFRQHQTLFGDTDYLRISNESTTELTSGIKFNSTEVTVNDASFMPTPTSLATGSIWIGSERIEFGRKDGNVLSLLTRGAYGTTPQDHNAGTPVYSAYATEYFNNLNPQANVWLDVGTRYAQPEAWDEIDAGLNGILDSQLGNGYNDPDNPTQVEKDDILRAWDELANGNITVSTVNATVDNATTTNANITLSGNMTLTVGEAVRITNPGNTAETEVVSVTSVVGNTVALEASYNDTLNTNIFVVSGTVSVSSFNYGSQSGDDTWDSAAIAGQTAMSLADRANADFTRSMSIMRFLHKLV